MGSLIASAAGSCLTYICCGACRNCSEQKYGAISRIPYLFLFFVAGIFALVMSIYGEQKIDLKFYDFTICQKETCAGNGSVYRVSFCLFIFELIHVIFIYCGAIEFHWVWYPIKFILFCGSVTATFFIHNANGFFNTWSDIARIASGLYLLLQLLILVTCAWDLNDFMQKKSRNKIIDNENYEVNEDVITWCQTINWWPFAMLGITLLMYGGAFTLLGLFYNWYGGGIECDLHNTLITITIVLCGLNVLISIARGNGSFMVSSIVSFYAMYLLFAGIQADPDHTCNKFAKHRNTISMWMGFLMTFVSLFYAAMRAGMLSTLAWREVEEEDDEPSEKKEELLDNNNTNINMEALDKNDPIIKENELKNKEYDNYKEYDERYKSSKIKTNEKNEDLDEFNKPPKRSVQRKQNTSFHFILMLGSAYMCMLFTNWGTNSNKVDTVGIISLWVNMVSQWVVFLLFFWTLIAPFCCPNRFPLNDDSDDE